MAGFIAVHNKTSLGQIKKQKDEECKNLKIEKM